MDIKSYNNFLMGRNIIEPSYDNFAKTTTPVQSLLATGRKKIRYCRYQIHKTILKN